MALDSMICRNTACKLLSCARSRDDEFAMLMRFRARCALSTSQRTTVRTSRSWRFGCGLLLLGVGALLGAVSTADAATATATWNANSEPDIAGYRLSYGQQSGTYTTVIDVGNVTTWTISNLNAGQRYYFAVQAYNTSAQLSAYSSEVIYDVPAAPTITALTPPSGPVGSSITITGTSFGATRGTSTVSFNGTAATPTTWSATSITAPVPAGATTGTVVVTVGGSASNGVAFTVTVPPTITTLTPATGPVGSSIT